VLVAVTVTAGGGYLTAVTGEPPARPSCVRPSTVANVTFAKSRYPNIRRHYLAAVRKGWPTVLKVNRPRAGVRRDRLLRGIPTRPGFDRDEYPPAVGRGRWQADVAYVASRENRSHGSALGARLRRLCDGTRFRYVFGA